MKIRSLSLMMVAAALITSGAALAGTDTGNSAPLDASAGKVMGGETGNGAVQPALVAGKVSTAEAEFGASAVSADLASAMVAVQPQLAANESPVAAVIEGAVLGLRAAGTLAATRYDVRYRPRRGNSSWNRRAPDASSVSQIHLGWYDQDGDVKPEFLAGIRGGPMLNPNFQLGAGVDWAHKSSTTSTITRRTEGPNGIPIDVREDLGEVSTHFVPVYAFAQIQADDDMPVVPYFGGSLGYQLMFLHADDFQTNNTYDATFGGWGWQAWGGAGVPLSGRTRITGEIFVNGGELHRDVDDVLSGGTIRESIDADGLGARFGVAWGF